MPKARWYESQTGIKTAGRNINNLWYTDKTALMAENKELKSLLMKLKKKSEKATLKLFIQNTKTMASDSITSRQIDGEKVGTVTLYVLGLQTHCRWWLQPWN